MQPAQGDPAVTLHQNARTCPASRRLLCQRIEEEEWTLRQAAAAAGLSERRAREWLGRWRSGDHALEDRSSVARQLPHRTPQQVEDAICALRELRFSGTRIAATLGLPERTVRAVLARNGLSRLAATQADAPALRYERPTPGELIHIDVKSSGASSGRAQGQRRPAHPQPRSRLGVPACLRRRLHPPRLRRGPGR
jgi:AraC-like DNA-binding protein